MSYCRKGPESDLYIVRSGAMDTGTGLWCCYGCPLEGGATAAIIGAVAMLAHLDAHDVAGHRYPTEARARLMGDMEAEL